MRTRGPVGKVRFNTKLRASNVVRKKPPLEAVIEKLGALKQKHKKCLSENRALAKSLAVSRAELIDHCLALKREREIFSIHLPRIKTWMEDGTKALHRVLNDHINAMKLLRQILDPNSRLSLTPLETSTSELNSTRRELEPPGSRLQGNVSPVCEEDEDEEEALEEEVPLQKKLDNVTRRPGRSTGPPTLEPEVVNYVYTPRTTYTAVSMEETSVGAPHDLTELLAPFALETPPRTYGPAGKRRRSSRADAALGTEVPKATDPATAPKASPKRSSRRQSSVVEDRRKSTRRAQPPAEPLSSPQESTRSVTPSLSETASEKNAAVDSGSDASDRRSRRRAAQAVSYKEPSINKKLRRP